MIILNIFFKINLWYYETNKTLKNQEKKLNIKILYAFVWNKNTIMVMGTCLKIQKP